MAKQSDFVRVIDTETTGIDEDARLVEIGSVDLTKTGIENPHSDLVNPGIPIPPMAMAVHHITNKDVEFAMNAEMVLRGFGDASTFAAHNAQFDRRFAPFEGRWICTWKCALIAWPDAESHSNQYLRYWLGIEDHEALEGLAPHRALYDAICTAGILQHLKAQFSIEEMIEITSQSALLPRIGFGKHRGSKWSDVDAGYLRWVLGQDFDANTKHTAQYWLDRPEGEV